MKNLVLIVLLIFPLAVISQSWQVVNPAYTYFYSEDGSGMLKHTVQTDSVSEVTGHQVLYLNTIIKRCDTCNTPVPCFGYSDMEYYLGNIQGIFAKEIHQLENGRYWLSDSLSFVIESRAELMQSWIFDTTKNITAEVSALDWQELFPTVFDSVKTIALSDGKEIRLSKNYGILSFPSGDETGEEFHLAGLITSTEKIGSTPPGFWEIFDIEVGDIFQYRGYGSNGSFPPPNSDFYTRKVEITSKEQTANSVSFGQHIIKKYDSYSDIHILDETITFTNTPEFMANHLPGTLYDICADDQLFYELCNEEPHHVFSEMHHLQHPVLEDLTMLTNYDETNVPLMLVKCENANGIMANIAWEYSYHLGRAYANGLGQVGKTDFFFEQFDEYLIQGFVKDGDTTGTITPDDVLLRLEEIAQETKNYLHPNPAQHSVFLDISQESEVRIYDLKGQLVFSGIFDQSNKEIDLRKFNPGIYFVKIIATKKFHTEKLIVQ